MPTPSVTSGERREKGSRRRSGGKSDQVQQQNNDFNSYTSYYNNHSNTASPRLGRLGDSSCNFSFCPTTSENNLTSMCDKSPTTEEPKTPRLINSPITLEPPPNVLTPMLMNGGSRGNKGTDAKHDLSPMAENLGLLYLERLEQNSGDEVSAV